jgi:hypothetical protein
MIALKISKIDFFFFAYKIALNRIEVDVQELFLYSKKNYEKNVHNEDYSNQICSIHIFYIRTPVNKNYNNKGYKKLINNIKRSKSFILLRNRYLISKVKFVFHNALHNITENNYRENNNQILTTYNL